jgi:hypothetical protein
VKSITYPLPLSEELYREVEKTAQATRLSNAEAIRQSIALGLPALRQRLCMTDRITNVDPLPDCIASDVYSLPEDDEETIRLYTQAQSREMAE